MRSRRKAMGIWVPWVVVSLGSDQDKQLIVVGVVVGIKPPPSALHAPWRPGSVRKTVFQ
jgi:hypothetical protein